MLNALKKSFEAEKFNYSQKRKPKDFKPTLQHCGCRNRRFIGKKNFISFFHFFDLGTIYHLKAQIEKSVIAYSYERSKCMSKSKIIVSAINARDGSECEIEVPVTCNIRLIRNGRYGLKAIARIEYMGIVINDILVSERRGELTIRYPYRNFERNGETIPSTIVFPSSSDLGSKLNHIIQNAYSERILGDNNDAVVSVLSKDDTDAKAA